MMEFLNVANKVSIFFYTTQLHMHAYIHFLWAFCSSFSCLFLTLSTYMQQICWTLFAIVTTHKLVVLWEMHLTLSGLSSLSLTHALIHNSKCILMSSSAIRRYSVSAITVFLRAKMEFQKIVESPIHVFMMHDSTKCLFGYIQELIYYRKLYFLSI